MEDLLWEKLVRLLFLFLHLAPSNVGNFLLVTFRKVKMEDAR